MAVPATTGQLRTNIADMKIGDYIIGRAKASDPIDIWIPGYTSLSDEAPLTGMTHASNTLDNFTLIKVSKGLLIADRILIHSVSWDWLNANKLIQGVPTQQINSWGHGMDGGKQGIIRSLTGGVAYADANGNKSLTDQGFGAWPTNNEWDKYIVNFPSELIQEGKTLDDVFHWSNCRTWTQDTDSINGSGIRMSRGRDTIRFVNGSGSAYDGSVNGFRPVFEYKE